MKFRDVTQPELWAIEHIPSGKLLRLQPCGYGHTQLDVDSKPGRNIKAQPRLFFSEDSAKRSMRKWLEGVHRMEYEDGIQLYNPTVPRIKEDMRVIPIYLTTDAINNEPDY